MRNVFTVGGFTALSRVLGLAREMLQSRFIGAGVEQSAFALAFALPNMARKLFGEGALTAAFVPIFRQEVESAGREAAARLARAVLSMTLLMLGALVILAWTAVGVFAAAFAEGPRAALVCRLVAILMPYMIFICGAAFGMGVLNALGKFKASSMMPSLLNVIWIAALAVTAFFPGWTSAVRVQAVSGAILFAGAVQMAFLFVCMARAGVRPTLTRRGWSAPAVRKVWRNMAIGALGAGAVQVNYMLDQVLAQLAAPWAAAVIGYADRLMDLPLGVVGVAFGTVLLPTYAAHFAKRDVAGARAAFVSASKNMLFVMIPAAAGLVVLATETTDLVYRGGAFDAAATVRVARAVAVYALGLGFFGLQKTLVPWFQAQTDMKTPFRVSLATVALNATLNILAVALLPQEWRHVGLAGSTTICAGVGCVLLAVLACRRNGSIGLAALVRPVATYLAAAVLMAVAIRALGDVTAPLGRVPDLFARIAAGSAVYFALVFAARRLNRVTAKKG